MHRTTEGRRLQSSAPVPRPCETRRRPGREHRDFRRQCRIAAAEAHRGARKAPPIAVARANTSKVASESWLHRFLNYDELIGLYTTQDLTNARGPANLDVGRLRGAQAKMQSFIVGREIASRGRREASLAIDLNASTETVAIAALSVQCDSQPVKLAAAIEIKLRSCAKRGGNDIYPTVVVQGPQRRTATGHMQNRSGVGSFETPSPLSGQ